MWFLGAIIHVCWVASMHPILASWGPGWEETSFISFYGMSGEKTYVGVVGVYSSCKGHKILAALLRVRSHSLGRHHMVSVSLAYSSIIPFLKT